MVKFKPGDMLLKSAGDLLLQDLVVIYKGRFISTMHVIEMVEPYWHWPAGTSFFDDCVKMGEMAE